MHLPYSIELRVIAPRLISAIEDLPWELDLERA